MKLIINTDNFPLSSKTESLADKHLGQKLDKYLAKLDQEVKVARLTIKKNSRSQFDASFYLSLPQKKEIFARARGEKLLSILVEIREQAEKQIKKYKEKTNKH